MKRILITGATDGIGKALALRLDQKGYPTFIFGRTPQKMEALHLEHCIQKYTFDMQDKEALSHALEDIQQHGGIDVLINNAGFNARKSTVKDLQIDDLEAMLTVNAIAPLICIQKCLPSMLEKKEGMIVNVLSSCCLFYNPNNAGYTTSKKAIEAISKTLVKEVKDFGIKVLDVYPGGVDTNFREIDRPEYLKAETIAKHIVYAIENNDDGMLQEIVIRPIVENNY